MNTEQETQWKSVTAEMPDSDITVLVHHPDNDEPVWIGFHDGKNWRSVEAGRIRVSHWRDMPAPPHNAKAAK
jgi:hypothetical protein